MKSRGGPMAAAQDAAVNGESRLSDLGPGALDYGPASPDLGLALPVVVTSIQALIQPVPRKDEIAAATRTVHKGERIEVEEFLRWLVEHGFHATSAVELPGEFCHRGG